jgi:hypothetical protein
MNKSFYLPFFLSLFLFACVTSKKEVTPNQLNLYEKLKERVKSSTEFQNFKTEHEISCDGMKVSSFLAKPCYYYHYLDANYQTELAQLHCETESDNWGEQFTNLNRISDSKYHCLVANFSEIINENYILMEVSELNHSSIYISKLFIFKIGDNYDVYLVNAIDLLHE